VICEHFNLDRYGVFRVCAADENTGRIFQYTASYSPNVSIYSNNLDLLKQSCISLYDNSGVQNRSPVRFVDLYPVDSDIFYLREGEVITTLRGSLWINGDYGKYYYLAPLKPKILRLTYP